MRGTVKAPEETGLIVVEAPTGEDAAPEFASLGRQALARFLTRAQKAVQLPGEVTVLLADDARLKELNRAFRRKNKPTDVLSFPAHENGEGIAGDLAISVETAARQAQEHGHSLDEELRILMLHGLLHLAGYDHEVDSGEMRALEEQMRERLKLPSGLIQRAQGGAAPRSGPGRPGAGKPGESQAIPAKRAASRRAGRPARPSA